jgi:hypothetical protein
MNQKIFAIFVSSVVGVAIIAGFFVVGSPKTERMRQFDERRVNDLSMIQSQLISYWTNKVALPDTLDVLNDGLGYFMVPQDPENQMPYEYQKTGDLSFELCATFALSSEDATDDLSRTKPVPAPYGYDGALQTWNHGVGRTCFARTIDPELYRPNPQIPVEKRMPL